MPSSPLPISSPLLSSSLMKPSAFLAREEGRYINISPTDNVNNFLQNDHSENNALKAEFMSLWDGLRSDDLV